MLDSIHSELLIKIIQQSATKEEIDALKEWILSDPANLDAFKKEYEAYQKLAYQLNRKNLDTDLAWENLNKRLGNSTLPTKKPSAFRNPFTIISRIAASVAILFSVWYGGMQYSKSRSKEFADKIEFYSPSGEKSRITLAEGTVVWLNSASKLEYSVNSSRNVKLTGEAFFDVTKNPDVPFFVETPTGMKVKVLGTRFNVSAYPSDNKIETTLESGNVEVIYGRLKEPVALVPGEQLLFDIENSAAIIRKVDTELYTLWKENTLKFVDTPFDEVVRRIERWYGIEIILDPELKNSERFTMTIKTESMLELLKMLQLTVKMNYKIDGEKIYIMKK